MRKLKVVGGPSEAPQAIRPLDRRITDWMAVHGTKILCWSLGIVFFWFGVLKFLPGASPAEDIASRTLSIMTFGAVPKKYLLTFLASWECAIGIGLLTRMFLRTTLFLLFLQMAGTLTPFLFFPNELFVHMPFVPTLEGQYIIKNIVLISAAIVIGATVRGGGLVADPSIAREGRAKAKQKTWKEARH